MNKELRKLFEWLIINRLSLNFSKTNYVIFHSKNKPKIPITIKINNKAIEESKYVKYLGILIDAQLNYKYHIEELCKKISRSIGILYKLRPFVTTKILTNVYYTIVYPFLLYGIVTWGSACNSLLNPLHIMQKRFVRMATFNDQYPIIPGPLTHTPPLFYKLGILNIFDIFKLQVSKFVYESINNIGPSGNIIRYRNVYEMHNHYTRHVTLGNFYNSYARTKTYGLRSLKYEGSKLWSTIPMQIRNSSTIKLYNKHFKKYLINSYQDL